MHARAAAGLPALSVNWGPWSDIGMAASLTKQQIAAIEGRGIRFVKPASGLAALTRSLGYPCPQLMIGEFDWAQYLTSHPAGTDALFDQVRPARDGAAADLPDPEALAAMPAAERDAAVQQILRAAVARVLRFGSPDEIDPGARFLELGLDSLAAVELKNSLEAAFRIALPTSALFDYPVLRDMAAHVSSRLAGPAHDRDAGAIPEPCPASQPGPGTGPDTGAGLGAIPAPDAGPDIGDAEADAELAALRELGV